MNELDVKKLRAAFGSYMTGVTVVSACAPDGSLVGFTANSFTSVSMDPPLLLACPGNHLSSFPVFEQIEHFAVNILSHEQESVSNLFASSKDKRFENVAWHADEHGCPILDNVAASFSCVVHDRVIAGDHMILIGRVSNFSNADKGGLGYCSNGYFSLENERQANTATHSDFKGFTGALIEYENRLLLHVDDEGVSIPTLALDNQIGARSALAQHFDSIGLDASIGPVFSLYDDEEHNRRYTFFKATALTGTTGGVGEYLPLSSIPKQNFSNLAQKNMAERFAREYQTNESGLYIGNSKTGEVHKDAY